MLRVLHDLKFTTTPDVSKDWVLPADLTPLPVPYGKPTENLLGWKPAIKLAAEQVRNIQANSLFVDAAVFTVLTEVDSLCTNLGLLSCIQNMISAEDKIKMTRL